MKIYNNIRHNESEVTMDLRTCLYIIYTAHSCVSVHNIHKTHYLNNDCYY